MSGIARCSALLNNRAMLFEEPVCSVQQNVLQGMTPSQRWNAARNLYWTLRRHKVAYLKSRHPDWTEECINEKVRHLFLYARS